MFHKEIDEIDDKQIAYIRTNEWKDDIILFFHGFFGAKEYIPNIEFNDVCIVSFDRPGIGDSSIEEYYAMESYLRNVHDILRNHNVRTVCLIGHSAGGYYAQLFAEMFPEMVKTLTLLSSMIPLNCPKTKELVKGNWNTIVNLSLKHKWFSKLYFKNMAKSINNNYEKQLAANMKSLLPYEKQFMEKNQDMIKKVMLAAVANNGMGVCYDAYALCLERKDVVIPRDIPIYIWWGIKDTTVPEKFVEYFKKEYEVTKIHMIDNIGHMLYLPYWTEIINEVRG